MTLCLRFIVPVIQRQANLYIKSILGHTESAHSCVSAHRNSRY